MNENPDTTAEHHKDYTGSKVGMWLFLLTEILLFGGMFLIYSVLRSQHTGSFHEAAEELDVTIGTLNTLVLLTSSLTIAVSISAIQKGRKDLSAAFLVVTILLASIFLLNKYFEWSAKIQHGLYPKSTELLERGEGAVLFYGLYYVMTGLHGLHVFIGIAVFTVMLILLVRGNISETDYVKLENSGLYWHLVDIIWIYLFPLFYLIS